MSITQHKMSIYTTSIYKNTSNFGMQFFMTIKLLIFITVEEFLVNYTISTLTNTVSTNETIVYILLVFILKKY